MRETKHRVQQKKKKRKKHITEMDDRKLARRKAGRFSLASK